MDLEIIMKMYNCITHKYQLENFLENNWLFYKYKNKLKEIINFWYIRFVEGYDDNGCDDTNSIMWELDFQEKFPKFRCNPNKKYDIDKIRNSYNFYQLAGFHECYPLIYNTYYKNYENSSISILRILIQDYFNFIKSCNKEKSGFFERCLLKTSDDEAFEICKNYIIYLQNPVKTEYLYRYMKRRFSNEYMKDVIYEF